VKGVAGDRKLVSPGTWQEVNWQNKPLKRGIKLFTLGVDLIKQALLGRCRVPAPGPKYLNLPQNLPPKYCQELAGSEVMVKKKKGGSWKYVWEPIPGVRNEPLDCAVYAYAAAVFIGIPRFKEGHWDRLRKPLATKVEANSEQKESSSEQTSPIVDTSSEQKEEQAKPKQRRQRPRSNYLSGYGKHF
jgi:phage terminase large subunit GpA-like protein